MTPDFIEHEWRPLASAAVVDGFVRVPWPDGVVHDVHSRLGVLGRA